MGRHTDQPGDRGRGRHDGHHGWTTGWSGLDAGFLAGPPVGRRDPALRGRSRDGGYGSYDGGQAVGWARHGAPAPGGRTEAERGKPGG